MGKTMILSCVFPIVKTGNISRKLLTKILKKKTKILSGYTVGGESWRRAFVHSANAIFLKNFNHKYQSQQ